MRANLSVEVWSDRAKGSLFLLPVVLVAAGILLAELSLRIDARLSKGQIDLASSLGSTVDGARAVLTTVATATVTVAGIAFSVALLVFQQASNQYSPRVVHSLFRDPFNKRVIAVVVGTFSYCLMVLRAVRGPVSGSGEAVVPSLSVALALLFGLLSLLAIVAFIDHSAHSLEISELLQRITDDTIRQIQHSQSAGSTAGLHPVRDVPAAAGAAFEVRADEHGWVQQIDHQGLLAVVPPDTVVRLRTSTGRFLSEQTVICTLSPIPHEADSVASAVRQAVRVGRTRTLSQDPLYGVRQLVDVAVKALSPGVNDPTTAYDAIVHLVATVRPLLCAPPPAPRRDAKRSVLVPAGELGHEGLVGLAFDEIRRDASSRVGVCVHLLEAIATLIASLPDEVGSAPVSQALLRQARLVYEGAAAAGSLPEDFEVVERAYLNGLGGSAPDRRLQE